MKGVWGKLLSRSFTHKQEKTISIPAPVALIGAVLTARGIYILGKRAGYSEGFDDGYEFCSKLVGFAGKVVESIKGGKESYQGLFSFFLFAKITSSFMKEVLL